MTNQNRNRGFAMTNQNRNDNTNKLNSDTKITRRKAVKTIAGGITALAAYHTLPAKWEKPILESIFIPAHAQTSGQVVEHSHPHTHDENHPDTHVDSHSHTDPHTDNTDHSHTHDTATTNHGVATISNLTAVEEINPTPTGNWIVSYVTTVTNEPVTLTYNLENLTGGYAVGNSTDTVDDGATFSGTFTVPFALVPPGDTIRLTATSSDPTAIITGSPLDFTTPTP